jgi:radical SAM-linked protein
MPECKYRLNLTKTGNARFISHLDLMRLLPRAFRRAALPVAYTEGFNPRVKLSLPYPLPLGMESDGEPVEVALDAPVDEKEIVQRLRGTLPPGISVEEAELLPPREKRSLRASTWRVTGLPPHLPSQERIEETMAASTLPSVRLREGREVRTDLRPFLVAIEREGEMLLLRLAHVEGKGARPDEVLTVLGVPPRIREAALVRRLSLIEDRS